jgi:hypothetical protein
MSEDAKRQIAFAVEQARMKYYPNYGVQLQFDAEKFAELMYPYMGIEDPNAQGPVEYPPEPEPTTVEPTMGITAAITAPEDILEAETTFGEERAAEAESTHEFRSDRGGKCLTCGNGPDDPAHVAG